MELRETNDGWFIETSHARVQLIQIDFRVGLMLSGAGGNAQLYVESPFHVRDANGIDHLLVPGRANTVSPVLDLFNVEISDIRIRKKGILDVRFANEFFLLVHPDENFEAWQIGTANFSMVCSPGGEITLFSQK